MTKVTYRVYRDGKVVSRFDEKVFAFNYMRNQAPYHRESEFAVGRIERIFDSLKNSTDKARMIRFRNADRDNSVHAGIRNSDLDIGRDEFF
jgi:hypothetical protein